MNKKVNAKKEAWKVVGWIFGVLILLAIIYLIWTFSMMA